jgi:hypothetical protein
LLIKGTKDFSKSKSLELFEYGFALLISADFLLLQKAQNILKKRLKIIAKCAFFDIKNRLKVN